MRGNDARPGHSAVLRRMPRTAPAVRASIRKSAGRGTTIVLLILFWLIFYQNLPGNFGLNALPGAVLDGPAGQGAANWLDRTIKVAMIGICLVIIASKWRQTRALLKTLNPGLTAFMVLAPLSVLWSIDSSSTLLRSVTLLTMVLVCFAVAVGGWSRERFQLFAIPPIMYILVASLVVGSLYPDRIIESGEDLSLKNAWHGVTHFKNQFGMIASIGIVFCFHHWLSGGRRVFWALAGIAAGSACLILSRSNTSQLATVVCVLFMVLVLRVPAVRQRYATHIVVGTVAVLLLYQMVVQQMIPGTSILLSPIASLTGKDTTFSSRTMIWDIIKDHIRLAPLLGTGYGAYWTGVSKSTPSYVFEYLMFFYPTEAHNGYLDIVNDLGLVGLACLLAFIFWFVKQALQLMRIDRGQATLYLALLFQQMIMNMSESEWYSRSNSSFVLILAATCLARDLIQNSQPPAAPQPVHGTQRPGRSRLRPAKRGA